MTAIGCRFQRSAPLPPFSWVVSWVHRFDCFFFLVDFVDRTSWASAPETQRMYLVISTSAGLIVPYLALV